MQRLFCVQISFKRCLIGLFQHYVGVVQCLSADVDFMARGSLERVSFHRVVPHPCGQLDEAAPAAGEIDVARSFIIKSVGGIFLPCGR